MEELRCPLCNGELTTGVDEETGEPVYFCDHPTETIYIFIRSNSNERIA